MKAYEMEMKFTATLGLKFINDMLQRLGDSGKYQVKDALTITIKQVLPCIPDDDYLRKVEQAIIDTYKPNKDFDILECHFSGYNYLKEIDTDKIRPKESEDNET